MKLMGKKRDKKNSITDKLKAEYAKGYSRGYKQGCKDGAAAPKPPVRYKKGADGKWYVFLKSDK